MITYRLSFEGRRIQEGTRRELFRIMRERGVEKPNQELRKKSSMWEIQPVKYLFQPQRLVDSLGTGVYTAASFKPNSTEKYPLSEELTDAIQVIKGEGIIGTVMRMEEMYINGKGGEKVPYLVNAGTVYSTEDDIAPTLTLALAKRRKVKEGGTVFKLEPGTLSLVCAAQEAIDRGLVEEPYPAVNTEQ